MAVCSVVFARGECLPSHVNVYVLEGTHSFVLHELWPDQSCALIVRHEGHEEHLAQVGPHRLRSQFRKMCACIQLDLAMSAKRRVVHASGIISLAS